MIVNANGVPILDNEDMKFMITTMEALFKQLEEKKLTKDFAINLSINLILQVYQDIEPQHEETFVNGVMQNLANAFGQWTALKAKKRKEAMRDAAIARKHGPPN